MQCYCFFCCHQPASALCKACHQVARVTSYERRRNHCASSSQLRSVGEDKKLWHTRMPTGRYGYASSANTNLEYIWRAARGHGMHLQTHRYLQANPLKDHPGPPENIEEMELDAPVPAPFVAPVMPADDALATASGHMPARPAPAPKHHRQNVKVSEFLCFPATSFFCHQTRVRCPGASLWPGTLSRSVTLARYVNQEYLLVVLFYLLCIGKTSMNEPGRGTSS
jgi:hypothetical protein